MAWRAGRTDSAPYGIARYYIQPAKPVQNAFIERYNRIYRGEILDADLVVATQEVQQLSDAWLVTYNEHRPHDALGQVPPLTYLARVTTRSESNSMRGPPDGEAYPTTTASRRQNAWGNTLRRRWQSFHREADHQPMQRPNHRHHQTLSRACNRNECR